MMRLLFGAVLALLVLYPTLAVLLGSLAALVVSQPAVLAFAAGVWAWPRITQRIRRWTA
jgi:hypothetical protein